MDREAIANMARQMQSKQDVLALLNRIKHEEMAECGMADKYHPFTMRHLNCYCNPNNAFHRYRHFEIPKKSGGMRQITAPRSRTFMLMLQYTNEILRSLYTPSDYAMGFAEGRSVVQNAERHVGHNYVFNIDLKDFFPSIAQARVWKRLQLTPFNFPAAVASVIAGLCAMKVTETDPGTDGKTVRYVLPQGAPTSPVITNMICDTLDRRLAGLARRFGLAYSRYADDITFSSMHNVYQESGPFRAELRRIISGQSFTINEKKTRLQKLGSRQEVTGLIISQKVNVTRKYIRDLRNILYIWKQHGLVVAESKFLPRYRADKGALVKGNPNIVNVIDGKLMYLKMVRGENDAIYQRLYGSFRSLVDDMSMPERTNDYGITYLETYTFAEIEKKMCAKLVITHSKQNRGRYCRLPWQTDYGKCVASVQSAITAEEETKTEDLSISRCKNSKGEEFWFVHKSGKQTIRPPKPVDIDQLNNDLDALLNT